MVVVLGVVLHDRAEAGHRGGAQVELRARDLAGEAGEVPAPEEDATGAGGDASRDRGAKRLPGRVLVAGPMAGVGRGTGEASPAKGDCLLAKLGVEVMERGGVEDRKEVVRGPAVAAVGVAKVGAPGVFAAVGLEAV